MQTGKLHFGVILGWSVVSSLIVWLVVNSMAGADNPDSQHLGLYSCCCLLGYCLLPMMVFAVLALIIPRYTSCMALLPGYCGNGYCATSHVCVVSVVKETCGMEL